MNKRKRLVSLLAGIMAAILLLSLLLSLIPVARAASSGEIRNQIDDLKAQQNRIRQEMEDLKKQLKENESEIENLISKKIVIDQEIFLIYEEINNINEQISAFALLIADKQEELIEAQARFQDLSDKNKERIRAMEEGGEINYWSVLFQANSFSDLLDRLNMVQEIAAADQRRLKELDEAAKAVKEAAVASGVARKTT